GGSGVNSRFAFTVAPDVNYAIRATSYSTSTGSYTIAVRQLGDFGWSSGETPGFVNWASGEPYSVDADAAIFSLADGLWYSTVSSSGYRGLVEIPSAVDSDTDGIPNFLDVLP